MIYKICQHRRTRTANDRTKICCVTDYTMRRKNSLLSRVRSLKKSQIIFKLSSMKTHQLQRQESNLRPLPYESNMQPHTPRCDIKTTYLHRPVAENKYPYIRNKSRRQERSRTSIYKVRAYCANHYTTYRKSCDFHKRQG